VLRGEGILELDGGQHALRTNADAERTGWLESQGFKVVRFWNHEVFEDWDVIEQELWRLLTAAVPARPGSEA
jgi:very-short-patch-repair endonuclease